MTRPSPWRDLRKRALSALLMLPLAVAAVWLGGWAWGALLALGIGLLGWEWCRLCGGVPRQLPGWLMQLAALGATLLALAGWPSPGLALAALASLLALVVFRGQGDAPSAPWLAFGMAYVALAGVALVLLRQDPVAGRGNLLFLLVVVWASDIGAYLAGRLLGGPKLAPAISPGKTWTGAAGGLVSAVAVGAVVAQGATWAMAVAGFLGLVSQLGDLLESWVKRRFRVKDSSALIPGHGGLLDRVDGVLAAAPVAAMLALGLGQGGVLWK